MAKSDLIIGLTEEQKATLENELKTTLLVEQLLKVFIRKLEANDKRSIALQEYSNPSWPYFQADGIGYKRAYQEMLNLLTNHKETK